MGLKALVPVVGVEPTLPCGKQILSLPRLPFRHTGADSQHSAGQGTSEALPEGALRLLGGRAYSRPKVEVSSSFLIMDMNWSAVAPSMMR